MREGERICRSGAEHTAGSPIPTARGGCAPAAPTLQGLSIPKRGCFGAAGRPAPAAQACWGVHAAGARLLQAPSHAGSSAGAEPLGASSGLSLRAWLEAELTRYAAASEPELRCNAGDTRAQPLTRTISLQINLKSHNSVTSVGVQMTEWGPAGQEAQSEDSEMLAVSSRV